MIHSQPPWKRFLSTFLFSVFAFEYFKPQISSLPMGSQGFQKPDFRESDVAERSPCRGYARYKKILGRGAFKDVYKGFDHVNNMEIAWNQICVDDDRRRENLEALCSEAVLLNSLNHRNVMKCYSYWVDYDNKSVNIITEFVQFWEFEAVHEDTRRC
ncbi:putative serine/threonine-protein kinase WNK4 [Sesamum angolense]|uniref:non-specific serine/threonine protein kinase n=1 Tax=Sesamum angolense TaxID=2727404 RepID=A0AAE1X9Q9_9LAMI|nr:putative serine/threonine-protein kinase WNK4 [Sesamum angolense]